MTTFPLRITKILQDSLLDLIKQDYTNIKGLCITIPMENMRGQAAPATLPSWFYEEPIASKVTVLRPKKDSGPILKYIGAASVVPKHAWVFACDDDQRYSHNYISNLVKFAGKQKENRNDTIYNSLWTFEWDTMFLSMRLISGYMGVLFHRNFLTCILANFQDNLPVQCKRIDDDLVSLYARDNGFTVKAAPGGINFKYFLRTGGNTAGSLLATGSRLTDRHFTHKLLNSKYADNLAIASLTLFLISIAFLTTLISIAVVLARKR